MKKWEDIPVEELRDVCRKLFDGVWGDDRMTSDPIQLNSATNNNVRTTDDRVTHALEKIHLGRVMRVAQRQLKVNNLDVLLLGVTDEERVQISVAIKTSITDYLRPLADLIGLWDDDDLDDEDDEADVAAAASEVPVEPPPPPEKTDG